MEGMGGGGAGGMGGSFRVLARDKVQAGCEVVSTRAITRNGTCHGCETRQHEPNATLPPVNPPVHLPFTSRPPLPQQRTSVSHSSPPATPAARATCARKGTASASGPRSSRVRPGGERSRHAPRRAAGPTILRRWMPRLAAPPAHASVGVTKRMACNVCNVRNAAVRNVPESRRLQAVTGFESRGGYAADDETRRDGGGGGVGEA